MNPPKNAQQANELVRRYAQDWSDAQKARDRADQNLDKAGEELWQAEVLASEYLTKANIQAIKNEVWSEE
jgi:hypothetical protein